MLIDCGTCVARDIACHDCVVTVLLSTPPRAAAPVRPRSATAVELDDEARAAISHLASAGLVPPLRLVAALPDPSDRDPGEPGDASGAGREIA